MHGGYQSRVVRVTDISGTHQGRLVAKLIDTRDRDRTEIIERIQVRDRVARYDDRVVPLLEIRGNKVNRIGNCLAIVSPEIIGRPLDVTSRPDVERMGRALARLHQSLRLVDAELPVVPPLRAGPVLEGLHDNHQILHGDFASSNLLLDDDGLLWIFDFDDCGYGPVEFELGNTLFMALFQTSPSLNQPTDEYRSFRRWFVGAYSASAELPISELLIDIGVQQRSDALRYWLRHLDEAPSGIRNASSEWHRHLRAFSGLIHP